MRLLLLSFMGWLTTFVVVQAQTPDTVYLSIAFRGRSVTNTYIEFYAVGSSTPLAGSCTDAQGRATLIVPDLPLVFDISGMPPTKKPNTKWWLRNHPLIRAQDRAAKKAHLLFLYMDSYVDYATSLDPPTHDYDSDPHVSAREDKTPIFDPDDYRPPRPEETWWLGSSTKINNFHSVYRLESYQNLAPMPIPNQPCSAVEEKE